MNDNQNFTVVVDKKRKQKRFNKSAQQARVSHHLETLENLVSSETRFRLKYTPDELKKRLPCGASKRAYMDRQKFEKQFNMNSLNLTPHQLKIYNENPHIRSIFANREPLIEKGRKMEESDCILDENSGRCPYRRRIGEAKTSVHWGQLKLLSVEIRFLDKYAYPGCTVVYAGAADGVHIAILSKLFPDVHFVLVDPARFGIEETANIRIINDYFTEDMAKQYAGRNVLFISDIRSFSRDMSDTEREERVSFDMDLQMKCHLIMDPLASLLKFRFVYPDARRPETLEPIWYLDGEIWLQAHAGRTSTEGRLVVERKQHPAIKKKYDPTKHEQQMFFHNTVTRTSLFEPHGVVAPGLDGCFDCSYFAFVLKGYVQKREGALDDSTLNIKTSTLATSVLSELPSMNYLV